MSLRNKAYIGVEFLNILALIIACYLVSLGAAEGQNSTVASNVGIAIVPTMHPATQDEPISISRSPASFYVCVDRLAVKNNPGDQFPALRYLSYGEPVRIRERSHGILGWAMIAPAVWVWEPGLCPAE